MAILQLGVGVHLGTALLQLYGEVGVQPLHRSLERIQAALDCSEDADHNLEAQLREMKVELIVFQARFSNEYVKKIKFNSFISVVLTLSLAFATMFPQLYVNWLFAIGIILLATLPAPLSLASLSRNASRQIEPLKKKANQLEEAALQ